jgi:hypothetical protein
MLRLSSSEEKLPEFDLINSYLVDPGLCSVTPAVRGVFMDVVCRAAHSGEPGFLVLNGKPQSRAQLAQLVRGEREEKIQAIEQLIQVGAITVTNDIMSVPLLLLSLEDSRRKAEENAQKKSEKEAKKKARSETNRQNALKRWEKVGIKEEVKP